MVEIPTIQPWVLRLIMQLSDAPGSRTPWVAAEVHVPFTAFLKADLVSGNRQAIRRYFEKQSAIIEQVLNSFCNSSEEEVTFDFSIPVGYTPRFGNQTARFTINGHACKRKTFTKLPVGEQTIDCDNRLQTGNGAGNAANMIPSTELDDLAGELVHALESVTGREIIRIKLAGYIYGFKGTHIP